MKVLFWIHHWRQYLGGTETFASILLPHLRNQGHDVTVIASHGDVPLPDVIDHLGIPIHRFHFYRALQRNDIDEIGRIKTAISRIKREFAPDLIHMNSVDHMYIFHHLTASQSFIPYLITAHGRIPERLAKGALIRQLFQKANWTVAVSNWLLTDLRKLWPEITPCSSHIYTGIPAPRVEPESLSQQLLRLLCIGRLIPVKQFDVAIRAFERVRSRVKNIRLTIAGDGPQREELEQLSIDLGIDDAVDFIGWVQPDNVPEVINTSTIVLMPSAEGETFGLVAIEAALMCRPVIASRVSGLVESVSDNETGILVEPGSVEALSEAIVALSHDLEKCARLGQQARKRALEQFNVQQSVDAYTAIYQMIANKSARVG
jgi:glycosyltransferase involved in cell wall biosynthesis